MSVFDHSFLKTLSKVHVIWGQYSIFHCKLNKREKKREKLKPENNFYVTTPTFYLRSIVMVRIKNGSFDIVIKIKIECK